MQVQKQVTYTIVTVQYITTLIPWEIWRSDI